MNDNQEVGEVVLSFEDLKRGAVLRGVTPDGDVRVVDVQWYGDNAVELTYKSGDGKVDSRLLYRDDEAQLDLVTEGRPWSLDSGRPSVQ